jgi:hypothetical protein
LRFDPTPRLAAAVFAVLVVLFFHQVALEGKTFVAPDTTAPAGFVRVGEQALFRDHVYPLWNPYVFLGMPSFASGAYNPLIYPPDWPLALIQRVIHLPDMTWLLLYYFLGAWFLYLLAREWGARGEGALLAGAAFVFMPNLVAVGSHGHGSQLVDSAYIPLVLWLTARWLKRGRLHHLGWLALAGGFQMLRGHAQIVFYTWLAVGLYLIVDLIAGLRARDAVPLRLRLGRAAGVLAAMGLAFGLAGFYNLPLRDYARYSIRGGGAGGGVGVEYATSWSMAPWELPSILVPGAVGFGGATYWGAMPFTDYPNAYVGIVAAVLAVPAFLNRGVPRLFAILLAAVALLISFGKHLPLYGFLYDHLPLFNKFRVPVMILVLFQLSAALAVAWGWSRALDEAERPEARRGATGRVMLGTGAILALVLVLGVLGQQAWHEAYLRALHAHRSELPVGIAEQIFAQCVADLGRVVLLGLLAAGVVLLAARRRLSPPLGTLVALGLVLVDLWPISGRVMAPVIGDRTQNDLDRGRDDVVQFLEKAGPPSTFRVLPLDVDGFQSNQFATFGIASVGGYHAAKPRLFQDYYDAKMVDNVRWMRLLNVRYVILDNPLDSPFQPIFRGSRVVYQIPALPRATVVGAYRVVSPAKAIIDSVGLSSENGARMAWLEKDPGLRLGPVDGARADITRYGLNDVTIDVTTPGPGLLRLADLWFPGWLATVDGRAVEILKADFLLRAVAVPAGRHRVEFHYRPPAVRQGLTLSLVSLVLVLALLGLPRLLRTRPRPAAGEAA